MRIEGYKSGNDEKYYIPIKIRQTVLTTNIYSINFLIDTDASVTSISWNDANVNAILYKYLNEYPIPSTGIGSGRVRSYILPNIEIFFPLSNKQYWYYKTQDIFVSDHETTEGHRCPPRPSLLGMDIINQFELSMKDNVAYLIK